MEAAGLLQQAGETVYVEFGAGKGYLGAMVAEVARPRHTVLMDYQSCFRAKVGGWWWWWWWWWCVVRGLLLLLCRYESCQALQRRLSSPGRACTPQLHCC